MDAALLCWRIDLVLLIQRDDRDLQAFPDIFDIPTLGIGHSYLYFLIYSLSEVLFRVILSDIYKR